MGRKILILLLLMGCESRSASSVKWREFSICELDAGQGGYTVPWAVVAETVDSGGPWLRTDYTVSDSPGGTVDTFVSFDGKEYWIGGRAVPEHPMWNCKPQSERHWPGMR